MPTRRIAASFLLLAVVSAPILVVSCAQELDKPAWDNPWDPGGVSWTGPILTVVCDASGISPDSVIVRIFATDNDGVVVMYAWDIGASGWDDSSSVAPTLRLRRQVGLRVVAMARDDDGWVAVDTVAPPPASPPAGMVLIPAGSFQMGQAGIAEPVHSVTLSAFWMDSTEVTQA
jgi:hypothetical protein